MIQPNEIRVNNYYNRIDSINHSKLGFCKWDSSDWYRIGECIDYLENYEPIHLTEEILLKCGFSENLNVFCKYVEVSDEVNNNYDFVFKIIRTPDLWNNSVTKSYKYNQTHIKYLHQLQNIYFCITGEELTINL